MENNTRIERLTELKNLLDNHDTYFPRVKFNIGCWYVGEDSYQDYFEEEGYSASCDTAACALGSAALHKPFKDQGLHLNDLSSFPSYEGRVGYGAGAQFFGITFAESEWLFCPSYYVDAFEVEYRGLLPEHVSARVNKLIEHYTKFPGHPFLDEGCDFEDLPFSFRVVGAAL